MGDERVELWRSGEQDLRQRRRGIASRRDAVGERGRAHAREGALHGVPDAVSGAEGEPAAKRLAHHVGQPIAGDDAGDVGVERIGNAPGKRRGAERR